MRYYIGNIMCDSNYMEHHGIKGQKWGVRRFQNDDGTLTPEGQARYGGKANYRKSDDTDMASRMDRHKNFMSGGGGIIRGYAGHRTQVINQGYAGHRVNRLNRKADKLEAKGGTKRAEKLRDKAQAQKASMANVKAYMDHTSTGKMLLQNLTMGPMAHYYRKARSRGSSRVSSFFQSIDPTGISRAVSNKKAYGHVLQWSAFDD